MDVILNPEVPCGFYLGKLCKLEHRWQGLPQSLRYSSTRQCKECKSNWRQASIAPSAGIEYFRNYKAVNRATIRRQQRERLLDPVKAAKDLQQKNAYKKTVKGKLSDKRYKYKRRALESTAYNAQELSDRFAMFNNICAYCGTLDVLTVDHFVALSRGGKDEIFNIVPACRRCNCSKNDREAWDWYSNQSFFDWYAWNVIMEVLEIS